MNNKFIKFISDMRFAILYILTFMFVFFMAAFKQAGSPWTEAAWFMLSLLGIIVSITALASFIEALSSKRWPQYNATLIESSVRSRTTSSGASGRAYTPVARYEFSFNEKTYEGSQIDFSATSASEKWAQGVIDTLREKGEFLRVHVNPLDPTVSVIYPGVRLVHYLRFIVGPVMAISGVVFGLEIVEIT
jgi:hypothetical protein